MNVVFHRSFQVDEADLMLRRAEQMSHLPRINEEVFFSEGEELDLVIAVVHYPNTRQTDDRIPASSRNPYASPEVIVEVLGNRFISNNIPLRGQPYDAHDDASAALANLLFEGWEIAP